MSHEATVAVAPSPELLLFAESHAQDDAPPAPETSRPDLPPAISRVLHRALAKRPANRFPSVGDFAAAFANAVSAAVIEKPHLRLWMILIPVIFVHFFYRFNKHSQGRKEFSRHFLLTRERSLNAVMEALESDRKPDTNKIRQMATIPEGTSKTYIEW